MIEKSISYFLLSKVRIIVIFLFLFIFHLEAFDAEAKIGYYAPYNKGFTKVYRPGKLALGIEVDQLFTVWELPFAAFAEVIDFHTAGAIPTTIGQGATNVRTSFQLMQVNFGLKSFITFKGYSFYVGAAPTLNYIHVKNEWTLPDRKIKQREIGYLLRLGFAFFVKELLIDFSGDYFNVPVSLTSTAQTRFNFLSNVGGFRIMGGLGFRY